MIDRKISINSEKVLLRLINSKDPTETLRSLYKDIPSENARNELNGIVSELKDGGYIRVLSADNIPYLVMLSPAACVYKAQLGQNERTQSEQKTPVKDSKLTIFISHSSRDKEVADMLVDFLSGTGISKESIFCSSLPGNDVNGKISAEIKTALKESTVDIAILFNDYYQSSYCLNEAGVLWYKDSGDSVIVIALPEINAGNMRGFLNSEYKFHRLDSDTDVSAIYDAVTKKSLFLFRHKEP